MRLSDVWIVEMLRVVMVTVMVQKNMHAWAFLVTHFLGMALDKGYSCQWCQQGQT